MVLNSLHKCYATAILFDDLHRPPRAGVHSSLEVQRRRISCDKDTRNDPSGGESCGCAYYMHFPRAFCIEMGEI